MKIPLRFQMTENDSGKTTILNAISFLFDRESIDESLLNSVYKHSMKENDIFKEQESICTFASKILKKKKYNLSISYFSGEEVNIKNIKDNFNSLGCIIMRVYLNETSHYVLITNLDQNYVYLFDPYYLDEVYYDEERMVELILNEPFTCNRKINLKRFNNLTLKDFSMGPIDHRECLIINKK